MIDTLVLSLADYEIDKGSDLQIVPSDYSLNGGIIKSNYPLFTDSDGTLIEGKKAFHNAEDFNFTITPIKSSQTPNKISSHIQFSAPKVCLGSNYEEIDLDGLKDALNAIQVHLSDIGIKTNIHNSKLCRVDSFRNVIADEPFTSYQPILQVMQGQRLAKRDYGTTFLWANGQQQICVYDKVEEMKAKKQSITGSKPNTIRFEYRLLNGKKIQNTLGMSTAKDLIQNYDHVKDTYSKSLKSLLFKADSVPDSVAITVMEVENELKYFMGQGGHWFDNWLRARGARVSPAEFESLMKAAENVAPNRETRRRMKNRLKEARIDALNLEKIAPSKKTLGELYTELQSKVLMN